MGQRGAQLGERAVIRFLISCILGIVLFWMAIFTLGIFAGIGRVQHAPPAPVRSVR